MRALSIPVLLLIAAGCLSERSFDKKFEAKYCEEFDQCVTSDAVTCADLLRTPTAEDPDCELDKAAAQECLEGAWVCNDDSPGFENLSPPAACASVCGAADEDDPAM